MMFGSAVLGLLVRRLSAVSAVLAGRVPLALPHLAHPAISGCIGPAAPANPANHAQPFDRPAGSPGRLCSAWPDILAHVSGLGRKWPNARITEFRGKSGQSALTKMSYSACVG